ncbi:MAG: thrombospondin type 3 repeat:Cna B-type [Gammaproteobacteria bacterium]|nr:thrombospondin type 3 repeat:Cna B-type [Gammaproteobacteria bacterium]
MKFLLKALLATGLLSMTAAVNAMVLDFESIAAGTIIDDEFLAFGITVSATGVGGAPNAAVIFDSNNPTGGDTDLAAPFAPGPGNTLGELSPGNLLILQENDTCDANTCGDPDDQGARPAGTIRFDFANAVLINSLDFFDIEGAETGDVVLYGTSGVLAVFAIPSTGGDRQWQRLFMNVGGVTAMDINMGGSGAIDNLSVVIPVPGALLLMLGALAPLGLFRKRAA